VTATETPLESDAYTVQSWLSAFEQALGSGDVALVESLFVDDCHWRDLVAFTWHFCTFRGAAEIARELTSFQGQAGARGFVVAPDRAPPRRFTRPGSDGVEAIFDFTTATGRGSGVLRLVAQPGGAHRAWVLHTALNELTGYEEAVGPRRPQGAAYSRNFGGENWLEQRVRSSQYADREPAVLVVGAGQAGLGLAARLGQLGVDTLVVDKYERIGDNWRRRYHSLALHNGIKSNHMPYLPFPDTWPNYIPKDMLANWFEFYVDALEINAWTGTEFVSGSYDEDAGCWSALVRRADGTERTLKPRHIVMANGVSGIPKIPELAGLDDFDGTVVHASAFTDGSQWQGKRAIVIGTGNSGHDVAQDLHSHGVHTTIVQRGSTTVVSLDPSAKLNFTIYDKGLSLGDVDLLISANPYPLMIEGYKGVVKKMLEYDKELIGGLVARGFKFDVGEDETGHQMKYMRRGGGYYLDVGCSGLIIDGEIDLLQFDRIEHFSSRGALLTDGTVVEADLIVLATGYHTQQALVRRVLGEEVADRVGPIWGWDESANEMCNMWRRTAQPGLWFMAGSLPQCRIYSKYLALQIKASEEGLLGPLPA
jgi:cation diffusion facilitator CzcD-associated flavoprotein CzcO